MTIQELKNRELILLECISGSKAYGLDLPESDTDIKGVFYLPKEQFYGWRYLPQVANETNDEVYYELGRFVELLSRNNPNILELLATSGDAVLYRHAIMNHLKPEMILSRLCKETFAGYAMTQIRKARGYKKKIVNPVDATRKTVPDFCYIIQGHSAQPVTSWLAERGFYQNQCGLSAIPHSSGIYALYLDTSGTLGYKSITKGPDSNEVALSSIPKDEIQSAYLVFNAMHYSAYCREYREYWDWVAGRNEVRYAGNKAHGRDYDAKNMMHTIRLLQVAEEILSNGTLSVRRKNREDLLAIKRGEYEYDVLLEMADKIMRRIEIAAESSALPEVPDHIRLEQTLIMMRSELYR